VLAASENVYGPTGHRLALIFVWPFQGLLSKTQSIANLTFIPRLARLVAYALER
jgi:hypothetical protein